MFLGARWQTEGYDSTNGGTRLTVTATSKERHPCTEAEAHQHDGSMELALKPVQGRADVVGLSRAVMDAFTEPGAAKVESQYRPLQTEVRRVERLHRVVDNLVVHGAAAARMRMADESRAGGRVVAFIEQSFKPAGRTRNEQAPQSTISGSLRRTRGDRSGHHSTDHFTRRFVLEYTQVSY